MAKKLNGLEKARAVRAANVAKAKAEKAQAPSSLPIDQEEEVVAAPTRLHRQPQRQTQREPVRTPNTGRIAVQGRNGEQLTRKRTMAGDIFAIPDALIPPGWSYQWCAIEVIGNKELLMDQNLMMAENGWRPVPASRYPGRFMPAGYEGNIVRGGQMLMERPAALTEEAKQEDIANARQLISDRNESLKLTQAKAQLPGGFEMGGKYRGTGGDIRLSVDRALDIPFPSHELADE